MRDTFHGIMDYCLAERGIEQGVLGMTGVLIGCWLALIHSFIRLPPSPVAQLLHPPSSPSSTIHRSPVRSGIELIPTHISCLGPVVLVKDNVQPT